MAASTDDEVAAKLVRIFIVVDSLTICEIDFQQRKLKSGLAGRI